MAQHACFLPEGDVLDALDVHRDKPLLSGQTGCGSVRAAASIWDEGHVCLLVI